MLIGVGLGPGDKELLTLKAVRLLRSADKVFVPGKMAYELVKEHCRPVTLEFPMVNDEDVIRQALERNADLIAPSALKGTAVLGILGDPNFFSTFSRQCEVLRERYPEVRVSVEPGISSITAFASRLNVPVNSGFTVTDGTEDECLVMLKVRSPRKVMKRLRSSGYSRFHLVERMYLENERVYGQEEMPEKCDYMSVMFARRE
ncbi:MAG: cobalt-factor II C(20)-methyltransferase [Methanomassiliicoccus sp.]|nr:cobalt-factor II C(20)-methyltransferase [Methanomassiliicoccus sp.]